MGSKAIVSDDGGFLIVIFMKRIRFSRWIPALIMMGVIFWFSSQPGPELPNFDWADRLVKKSGHILGYAILAASYWSGFGFGRDTIRRAWLLALVYAFTDEIHQSFVPGRHPSPWDVLVFDNMGAILGLWLTDTRMKNRRSDSEI